MADRFPLIVDASASPQPVIKEIPSGDVLDLTGTTIKAVSIDTTLSVTGNATIGGNLTVNGTTTTLNTATLDVEDKNITLNYGSGDTSSTADGSGITIQDAVDASNDATILWNATNDEFNFSHSVTLPDNGYLKFGADSDLLIFHNTVDSYIYDAGTGNLNITSDGASINLRKHTGGENMLVAVPDGAVTLYHDNAAKLATTATGIDVTGTANIDNLTINGAQGTADQVLTSSGSGVSWQDAGGGSTADADGDTQIQVEESADEDKIRFDTAGTERLIIDNNGHVLPGANNTYDLGATATRWRNIYTNDLQLSNEEGDANEVDNTKGSWTIQEGAEDLFIINRKTGKQYKFKLEEV
jgi:hypothetical protein